MLARRQINVQRDNLVSMCRISVKSLLDYACLYTQVDDDCEEFINFCAVFEQVVSHRLRPYQKKVWLPGQGSPRHFWDVLLENCNRTRVFQFQTCIPNIEAIETIKSPKAKLRAFIRVALMEKRLSDYLYWLLANSSLIRESYLDGAIFSTEEAAVLCGDLIGLNAIDFNFCLKGNENELLGPLEISYGPFLKYKQNSASRCHDNIEMLRLSGKDDEEDFQPGGILTESIINDVLRLQDLEKHVRQIKEQKDYLEELARLRERQINEANIKMENMKAKWEQSEKGREQERITMDACVLELQAEIIRLWKQNDSLKGQVASLKQFKQRMEMTEVPMIDMATGEDRDMDRTDTSIDMRRITERTSTSLEVTRKKSAPISSDQRSVLSLVSDNFFLQEDSQSMVPLAGSLADINVTDSEPQERPAQLVGPLEVQASTQPTENVMDNHDMKELSSAENMMDNQDMKELSSAENEKDPLILSFQITDDLEKAVEKAEHAKVLDKSFENALENKTDSLVDEVGKDTKYSEAVSESYILMEDTMGQTVATDSSLSQDRENSTDSANAIIDNMNLAVDSVGHVIEDRDVMAASGNSSSGSSAEFEKEEELVMSEPEIINPGNTSSDSDAAWEVLSDPEHSENKEEN